VLGDVLARVGAPVALRLPAPGDRFHTRYRVVRALGEGGMGGVFEVERLTDAQHLALKIVAGQVSGATSARFAREAEIGASVHHPNLISIVDVGIAEGGAPFLVMELVRGGSLEGRRARFGDATWGITILKQIAHGLSALHEAGVIHRDLKPANVLLDGDGEASPVAKISDFGISRFGRLDDAAPIDLGAPTVVTSTPKKEDLTETGALLGTTLYMAPEAIRGGRSLDAAADVFAFGLLAYEVLTGRVAFETPAVLVAAAGRLLPTPAPIENAALGVAARNAIRACLSEDPKGRPSARRICEALGAA
jgi:serine/threonine protein kinase